MEHEAWDEFVDWITGTDLNDVAQYEQAVQQLDIENFTSFIILHLWAGDTELGCRQLVCGTDAIWA